MAIRDLTSEAAPASGDEVAIWDASAFHTDRCTLGAIATLTGTLLNVTTNVLSGTWTPSTSGTTNVAALTAYLSTYFRVGNAVTISGRLDVTATAAATATSFDMTLPVTPAFAGGLIEGGGVFSSGVNGSAHGRIIAGVNSATTCYWDYISTGVGSNAFFFTFTYRLS